jgi:hypothetical protein
VEADAEAVGAVEQKLMEDGSTDAAAGACGECGLCGGGLVEKTDAVELVSFKAAQIFFEIEPDGCEGLKGVGHEAFAAGFIDRGPHGVDDIDLKAATNGGDGAG